MIISCYLTDGQYRRLCKMKRELNKGTNGIMSEAFDEYSQKKMDSEIKRLRRKVG